MYSVWWGPAHTGAKYIYVPRPIFKTPSFRSLKGEAMSLSVFFFVLINVYILLSQFSAHLCLIFVAESRMEQWRAPPTNVICVKILASTPYMGLVCCWFSPLLREVFPSPLKPYFSKFQFGQDRCRTTMWMCYLKVFTFHIIISLVWFHFFKAVIVFMPLLRI